jgi:hemerythrin-like domain-containing protein
VTPSPAVTTGANTATHRPTEPFRREHVQIKAHLDHLNQAVGALAAADPEERRRTMMLVVSFMDEHLKPHAEWEERVLYPAVDKRAGSGTQPFTASMRYEHRIVVRWSEELKAELAAPTPDVTKFVRRADNLLGLISAHFEEEEEVLLPILDRTMSPDEFEREIGEAH